MDGVIVIDKDPGMTSFDVVKVVKRLLNVDKAGHFGTLDPFATGVLPIAINKGTKLAKTFINSDKEYIGKMMLGTETDTQDFTGNVINEVRDINISEADIYRVFNLFKGKMKQLPPLYSAKKVRGIPLYKYARKGIDVERDMKDIEIYELTPVKIDIPFIVIKIRCSKGTYVRTLASDIGKKLKTFAHLVELRRVRSGIFKIEDAITINELRKNLNKGGVKIWH